MSVHEGGTPANKDAEWVPNDLIVAEYYAQGRAKAGNNVSYDDAKAEFKRYLAAHKER